MKQSNDPMCLLCQGQAETTFHILQCYSKLATIHGWSAAGALGEGLLGLSTHPDLGSLIIEALQLEDNYLEVHTKESNIQSLAAEQDAIG